jgi:hypothetical protein
VRRLVHPPLERYGEKVVVSSVGLKSANFYKDFLKNEPYDIIFFCGPMLGHPVLHLVHKFKIVLVLWFSSFLNF